MNDYSLRIVSSKVLVVRLNPGAKSPELGRLHYGAAVELVEKSGHFALIKWRHGESKVELQGWVFARYLSKFK
ncbi:MAG: SH3 domain-containing protein [Hydrogenophaga sp.]|nr:SH3 domain-containing protein [Hydrogenophaga sp.]